MPDPRYRLRLLGGFHLCDGDKPLVLGQPRLEELITYLVVHPDIRFARSRIAFLFWPDSSEKQALTNTRGLLYKLKQAWPEVDSVLALERKQLYWRPDAAATVDLHEFTRFEQNARNAGNPDATAAMQAAVTLYQGDLAPSCYSDWILTVREDLRARYATLLEALIDRSIARRAYGDALTRAKALRIHDPLRESTYRRLMEIHALLDDRAAALRVYHACATMLQNELGIEPSQPTRDLHDQLLDHATGHAATPQPPKQLERPRLIGRHREWQVLQQRWRAVQHGQAHCVSVWGEAGIGKTRLAEELIDWVRHLGHRWAASRSYAARGALTYAPIAEWLRAPAFSQALAAVDDIWRVEAARLLPELLAGRPDLPSPGPLTESWQQQRFYQSIVRIVEQADGPLLLHLDDMQWSDQETLTLLHFLLHGARTQPLLMLCTVRTEDAVGNTALTTLLDGLRRNDQLTELTLAPLTPEEVTALAEQTAGRALESEQTRRLYADSEGHPLFLIETVRSGLDADADAQQTHAPGQPSPEGMPPRIFQLLSTRMGRLSPQTQEIAATAAVIGRAFTYSVLHAVMALDELALIDGLDELWSRRIIREQEGDAYDFTHDRIRETAYLQLSRARRRLLHGQIARALEEIHAGALETVAAELAAHFAQAGDASSAFRYYRMAADVALNNYALSSAEEMLVAALDHVDEDPALQARTRLDLNNIYADTLHFSAWNESLNHIGGLLEQLSEPNQRLQIQYMLSRARYCEFKGERSRGLDTALQSVEQAEELAESDLLAHAYCELGSQYWGQTRMTDARRAYECCVEHAVTADTRPVRTRALELLAATGMFTGMPAGQISALLKQSFDLAQADDDKRQIAVLYNKFGYLPIAQGTAAFAAAEEAYQSGLALAREIGHRKLEENILANLIVLNTLRGDYRQALDNYHAAAGIGQEEPNRLFYWTKRYYQAATQMQMGELASARRRLQPACDHLGRLKNHHFEVKARSDLGLLHHLAGDQRAACDELCALLELIDGHGDLRLQALVNTRLGYVYEAMGLPDEALEAYAIGHDLHISMEQYTYALNARAGTARIQAAQGDAQAAYATAIDTWEALAARETEATVETARTLRTCYQIFRQQADARADAVLTAACTQLKRRAASIDDPDHVAAFWQLDDHRFFARIRQADLTTTLA